MEFNVKSGSPAKQRSACVVVGVFEPRRLSPAAEVLDKASGGHLSALLRRGDIEGHLGQTLLLHHIPEALSERVLLIGCGKEREVGDKEYQRIVSTAVTRLNETGAMECVSYLTEISVKGRNLHWKVRQTVETTRSALHRTDQLKSRKDDLRRPLRKLTLMVSTRADLATGEGAVREGMAIADGVMLAKSLGDLPGNICTPGYLAKQAQAMARKYTALKVSVVEKAQMKKLGMGALLSVTAGSAEEPKLIVAEYRGGKNKDKPVVLVGKGVTFDTGGISIKPSPTMDEMKYDMCGAASVLGALTACAELQLKCNVIGVIPACENMPSGTATKPGDIVTSMSGQTIEVLNTDAEGRLILCDALTYSERFDPEVVIDVATLTGACVIALGRHASAVMGNHPPLVHDLLNAGKSSGDRAWEMPLWDEYNEQLKSNFADIPNIAGREGGSITAACFLSRFTTKYHWAHMDIAGTAWISGENKGATGRPVPLLTQYLIDRCTEQKKTTTKKAAKA
ncbi:MAG: leucyl aminopeptidase [Gammaproteobacteria bacterium]|nr:leucyl aminopeptidase [Gammaproteobacteria bacterium]